jgi:hypothetical protein
MFMDYLAELSFTFLISNQPVEGSTIVKAKISFLPLGVFIVNDPIRSTSTWFISKILAYFAFMAVRLPHPQPRTRTDIHTVQRALKATQVRAALSHAYATTYHNRITDILTLVMACLLHSIFYPSK